MCKGKTIDVQDPRVIPVLSYYLTEYCPIKTLRLHVDFCEKKKRYRATRRGEGVSKLVFFVTCKIQKNLCTVTVAPTIEHHD